MSAAKEDKYTLMTTCPVERLVCRMAVPTIISMLVTGLYNIVDTFFVGRIGNEATAGVGLILPIMAIIQAFGFFFGQGSGNYISRSLGAKHIEKAEAMAATGSISALIFGVVLMAVGFVFKKGVLFILGAREGLLDPLTIRYAEEYMCIILCGAPFMCVSCVLNQQLRFQGNAVFSMVGLVSGAVLNCVLDPIFIFTLGMDVKGAALATVVGQTVSCLMLYAGTLRSDSLKIQKYLCGRASVAHPAESEQRVGDVPELRGGSRRNGCAGRADRGRVHGGEQDNHAGVLGAAGLRTGLSADMRLQLRGEAL